MKNCNDRSFFRYFLLCGPIRKSGTWHSAARVVKRAKEDFCVFFFFFQFFLKLSEDFLHIGQLVFITI
jgi:hypothetical protein